MDPFISHVTEEEIRRERARARELRNTQWWKRKRAAGVCHYCRKKVNPKDLTMDHIVPVIRGGKSTKGNLSLYAKSVMTRRNICCPLSGKSIWNSWGKRKSDMRHIITLRIRD